MAEQFAQAANTTLDNIPVSAHPKGVTPAQKWIQPTEKHPSDVLATTHQNAAAANGDGAAATVSGYGGIVFQVTGTFSATVNFEATVDGANWVALPVIDATGAYRTTATAPGIFWGNIFGLYQVRARISGYVSGNVTVISRAMPEALPIQQNVQISGRNFTLLVDRQGIPVTAGNRYIGTSQGGATGFGNPLSTDTYAEIFLVFENTSDIGVTVTGVYFFDNTSSTNVADAIASHAPNLSVPAGTKAWLFNDGSGKALYSAAHKGVVVLINAAATATTGSFRLRLYGRQ